MCSLRLFMRYDHLNESNARYPLVPYTPSFLRIISLAACRGWRNPWASFERLFGVREAGVETKRKTITKKIVEIDINFLNVSVLMQIVEVKSVLRTYCYLWTDLALSGLWVIMLLGCCDSSQYKLCTRSESSAVSDSILRSPECVCTSHYL